jgi:hypothetical protein
MNVGTQRKLISNYTQLKHFKILIKRLCANRSVTIGEGIKS